LRDAKAKAKGFNDIKLVGQVTQKLQDMTRFLTEFHTNSDRPPSKSTKEWACAHCHSEIHSGGMAACPLTNLKAKVARCVAKEAAKTIKDDPGILERLIIEEKKKEKE
jgi:hypothetical protein